MMYSAGIVQSASSSYCQKPRASCAAKSALRASLIARSRGNPSVLTRRKLCATNSPRASAASLASEVVFEENLVKFLNPHRSGAAPVQARDQAPCLLFLLTTGALYAHQRCAPV